MSGIKGGVGGLRKETAVLAVRAFSDCVRGPLWPSFIRVAVAIAPLGDSSGLHLMEPRTRPGDGSRLVRVCGYIPHPAVAAGKILLPAVVWEEGHEKACFWSHTAHLPDRYT